MLGSLMAALGPSTLWDRLECNKCQDRQVPARVPTARIGECMHADSTPETAQVSLQFSWSKHLSGKDAKSCTHWGQAGTGRLKDLDSCPSKPT